MRKKSILLTGTAGMTFIADPLWMPLKEVFYLPK